MSQTNKNPLIEKFNTKYESAPFHEIQADYFRPAIEQLIRESEFQIDKIAENTEEATFENTVTALEKNGAQLDRAVEILFNLNHAETNPDLQQIAQDVSPKLSEHSSRIMMNQELFTRVKEVYQKYSSGNQEGLNAEQSTVIENYYRSFIRNGAELKGGEKKNFARIKSELSKLSLQFNDNVLAETNEFILQIKDEKDLGGMPEFVTEAAALEAKSRGIEGWVFTLHYPSYVPFMKYCQNRKLRKKMFMAFSFRGNQNNKHDNKELIRKIVNLRLELIKILGEKDYASYVLKERMAEEPEKVFQFIESLHKASKPHALKDYREVSDLAAKLGHEGKIERWDWAYFSELLRIRQFDVREEEVKPYFELNRVRKGIFELAGKLYGLTFQKTNEIQVYHKEVEVYEVFDQHGEYISLLYLDFFPRKGKQGGAWMTDYRGQSNIGSQNVRPHVSIVCNFTRPTDDKPSLLSFDEVNTFLHEFGHALHGMLSKCTYPSVSGTNVFRDFVELPSQIMENWLTEKEWLKEVAVHYKSGERIPEEMIDKLIAAKNFQAGYSSERQLSFGMNDMAWHTISRAFEDDVIEYEKASMKRTELFPEIKGNCMSTAFSHIFGGGYAAGYYGYKWAEVLDADAFSVFREKGIFNRDVADSFRTNILEKGGSEKPMELYKRFRGREPSVNALLERSGLDKKL